MFTGLQLYSVRDALAADFEGTLKAVHEMGYQGVEFAGICGKTAAEVKQLCAQYDLVPISAHVALKEMLEVADTFKTYAEIGCKYIVIPYLPEEIRPTADDYSQLIAPVEEVCQKAKDAGLIMLYHNHDFEFVRLSDGTYFLDKLYACVSPALLQTELDTCWVNVAGEDPCEYVKKYSGRAPIVHLKDFYKKGKNVEGMYELIGIQPAEAASADEAFGFRPLGRGMQNVPAILAASKQAGAEWVIVEQDRPTPGKEPMDEVKASIDYLKTLTY